MDYKDYYKALGVSKTATKEEIRKAFRSLARKYHPDVAENKILADHKFKEINEAYEVLSDPAKRARYDQMRPTFAQGNPARNTAGGVWQQAASGTQQGDVHFEGTGFSDFFEQFFGGNGGFFKRGGKTDEGGFSKGFFGKKGEDLERDIMVTVEEAYNGSTRKVTVTQTMGNGQEEVSHFKVRIPAGVRDGQRLKVQGKGEQGTGRGKPGNLYLNVKLASHPLYRVQGGNLYYDLELAPWEAGPGAKIILRTLGGSIAIKIPPGTTHGQMLRVKNKGLPDKNGNHDDLYLNIHVVTPTHPSAQEVRLWEQLRDTSTFNPRSI